MARNSASRPGVACLALWLLLSAVGCHLNRSLNTNRAGVVPKPVPLLAPIASQTGSQTDLALPLEDRPTPEEIIRGQRKRVLGRRTSFFEIQQIESVVHPIITEAAGSNWATEPLRQLAVATGCDLDTMRSRWVAMQDADILLESGGYSDAISYAGACGAAQWMPGPAQARGGLKVDVKVSGKLTIQLDGLERQLDVYSREGLVLPERVDGKPLLPLVELRNQIAELRARRAIIDERFDMRKSVTAQTKYLLGLVSRFPSPSWLFQAYHGGEAGVEKTLRLWFADAKQKKWPGSARNAILKGDSGNPLTFEDLYLTTRPTEHKQAFTYLFSRGDDHRHYWWKLRTAEEGFAEFEKDPAVFQRTCALLSPGDPPPSAWYGAELVSLHTMADLQQARNLGFLVPVAASTDLLLPKVPADPLHAADYHMLQPEAAGTLALISAAYRQAGGKSTLHILDLVRTQELNALIAAHRTSKPGALAAKWGPDPPDYRTVGLQIDFEKPSDPATRRLLDYCLGYLEDRGILCRMDPRGAGRWQCVPNPRYGRALAQIAATGAAPLMPGL